ncbi:MAG: flagellar motor switch protein FliG [Cereibacter sphaeroides]|uniref:Flagellar motor switch protein FliG n=1 Tax=Cereibacter sphaeroides TaxID=1063 RepID=A0A2W5UT91_CERSP|nr:MAG: flagellar motor switch protein FliG [Cereibacter sphaeroides]
MRNTLGQITPLRRIAEPVPQSDPAPVMDGRAKAAVIVRLLLAEGGSLPLDSLPEHMQSALAEQIGRMRLIDRKTLEHVVSEFAGELEQVGLAFPGGIEGALSIMDGHISATAANRLRRLAGASAKADPWDHIMKLDDDRLLPVLEEESVEVAAVMLSKLSVPKAAGLLGRLPGDRARRVAYAVSLTGNVDPETVRRIGHSLASQLDTLPPRAFEAEPVERVGAILNISAAATRDEVLRGLDETDAAFARKVRRAIFTFAHLPARLPARDVPKLIRVMEQPILVTALASASSPEDAASAEFLLANLSQRMAQALREEMAERGQVREKDAEAAMAAVITAIRELVSSGEVTLTVGEE